MASEADIPAPICEPVREETRKIEDTDTNVSLNKLPKEEKTQTDHAYEIHETSESKFDMTSEMKGNESNVTFEGEHFIKPSSITEFSPEANIISPDAFKVVDMPSQTEKDDTVIPVLGKDELDDHPIENIATGDSTKRSQQNVETTYSENLPQKEDSTTSIKDVSHNEYPRESDRTEERAANELHPEKESLQIHNLPTTVSIEETEEKSVILVDDMKHEECLKEEGNEAGIHVLKIEKEQIGKPELVEDQKSAESALLDASGDMKTSVSNSVENTNLTADPREDLDHKIEETTMNSVPEEPLMGHVQNLVTIVSNEETEENSLIQVDGSKMKHEEHLQKETEKPLLKNEEAREFTLPSEEAHKEKPAEFLHVASEDTKAFRSGASLQGNLDEDEEKQTIEVADKNEQTLQVQCVAETVPNDVIKENSSIQVNGLQAGHLEKENEIPCLTKNPTESTNADLSKIIHEVVTVDDDFEKDEVLQNQENIEATLLKKALQMEKPFECEQASPGYLQASCSSQDTTTTGALDDESITEDPQGTPSEKAVDKTTVLIDKAEDILKNVSTISYVEAQDDSLANVDNLQTKYDKHLEKESEEPPVTEAPIKDLGDADSRIFHEMEIKNNDPRTSELSETQLLKVEAQTEEAIEYIHIVPENIETSSSIQNMDRTCLIESPTVDPQVMQDDKNEDKWSVENFRRSDVLENEAKTEQNFLEVEAQDEKPMESLQLDLKDDEVSSFSKDKEIAQKESKNDKPPKSLDSAPEDDKEPALGQAVEIAKEDGNEAKSMESLHAPTEDDKAAILIHNEEIATQEAAEDKPAESSHSALDNEGASALCQDKEQEEKEIVKEKPVDSFHVAPEDDKAHILSEVKEISEEAENEKLLESLNVAPEEGKELALTQDKKISKEEAEEENHVEYLPTAPKDGERSLSQDTEGEKREEKKLPKSLHVALEDDKAFALSPERKILRDEVEEERPVDSFHAAPQDDKASVLSQDTTIANVETEKKPLLSLPIDPADDNGDSLSRDTDIVKVGETNLVGSIYTAPNDDKTSDLSQDTQIAKEAVEEESAESLHVLPNDDKACSLIHGTSESKQVQQESAAMSLNIAPEDDEALLSPNKQMSIEVTNEEQHVESLHVAVTDDKAYDSCRDTGIAKEEVGEDKAIESLHVPLVDDKAPQSIIKNTNTAKEDEVEKLTEPLLGTAEDHKAYSLNQEMEIATEETGEKEPIESMHVAAKDEKAFMSSHEAEIAKEGVEKEDPVKPLLATPRGDEVCPLSQEVEIENREAEKVQSTESFNVAQKNEPLDTIIVKEENPIESSNVGPADDKPFALSQDMDTKDFLEEQSLITNPERTQDHIIEKTNDVTNKKEENLEVQNGVKRVSNEETDMKPAIKVDCCTTECSEKEKNIESLTGSINADLTEIANETEIGDEDFRKAALLHCDKKTESTLLNKEAPDGKPTEYLPADVKDIKATSSSQGEDTTRSLEEQTYETNDASIEETKDEQSVATIVPKDETKDDSPITRYAEVSEKERQANDDGSAIMHKPISVYQDETEDELSKNEQNVECYLFKQEAYKDKTADLLQETLEDINGASSQDINATSSLEEQTLTSYPKGILGDQAEENTVSPAEVKEETPNTPVTEETCDTQNSSTIFDETEQNPSIQVDGLQMKSEENLKKQHEMITETSTENNYDDEPKFMHKTGVDIKYQNQAESPEKEWESTLLKQEEEMGNLLEPMQVPPKNIPAFASVQDTAISSIDKQSLTTNAQEIYDDKAEEKIFDAVETEVDLEIQEVGKCGVDKFLPGEQDMAKTKGECTFDTKEISQDKDAGGNIKEINTQNDEVAIADTKSSASKSDDDKFSILKEVLPVKDKDVCTQNYQLHNVENQDQEKAVASHEPAEDQSKATKDAPNYMVQEDIRKTNKDHDSDLKMTDNQHYITDYSEPAANETANTFIEKTEIEGGTLSRDIAKARVDEKTADSCEDEKVQEAFQESGEHVYEFTQMINEEEKNKHAGFFADQVKGNCSIEDEERTQTGTEVLGMIANAGGKLETTEMIEKEEAYEEKQMNSDYTTNHGVKVSDASEQVVVNNAEDPNLPEDSSVKEISDEKAETSQEKIADFTTHPEIKVPDVSEEVMVNIAKYPNHAQEDSHVKEASDEKAEKGHEKYADVSSQVPEASEKNIDPISVSGNGCNQKPESKNIEVLDDESTAISTKENLLKADEKDEMEAEVPYGQRELEMQQNPVAEPGQKQIEEIQLINASRDASEADAANFGDSPFAVGERMIEMIDHKEGELAENLISNNYIREPTTSSILHDLKATEVEEAKDSTSLELPSTLLKKSFNEPAQVEDYSTTEKDFATTEEELHIVKNEAGEIEEARTEKDKSKEEQSEQKISYCNSEMPVMTEAKRGFTTMPSNEAPEESSTPEVSGEANTSDEMNNNKESMMMKDKASSKDVFVNERSTEASETISTNEITEIIEKTSTHIQGQALQSTSVGEPSASESAERQDAYICSQTSSNSEKTTNEITKKKYSGADEKSAGLGEEEASKEQDNLNYDAREEEVGVNSESKEMHLPENPEEVHESVAELYTWDKLLKPEEATTEEELHMVKTEAGENEEARTEKDKSKEDESKQKTSDWNSEIPVMTEAKGRDFTTLPQNEAPEESSICEVSGEANTFDEMNNNKESMMMKDKSSSDDILVNDKSTEARETTSKIEIPKIIEKTSTIIQPQVHQSTSVGEPSASERTETQDAYICSQTSSDSDKTTSDIRTKIFSGANEKSAGLGEKEIAKEQDNLNSDARKEEVGVISESREIHVPKNPEEAHESVAELYTCDKLLKPEESKIEEEKFVAAPTGISSDNVESEDIFEPKETTQEDKCIEEEGNIQINKEDEDSKDRHIAYFGEVKKGDCHKEDEVNQEQIPGINREETYEVIKNANDSEEFKISSTVKAAAAELPQKHNENTVSESECKKDIHHTVKDCEGNRESTNITTTPHQEDCDIKHQTAVLPELSQGKESEEWDDKDETCTSDKLQWKDEEIMMRSTETSEDKADGADSCSRVTEPDTGKNSIQAEKLDGSPHTGSETSRTEKANSDSLNALVSENNDSGEPSMAEGAALQPSKSEQQEVSCGNEENRTTSVIEKSEDPESIMVHKSPLSDLLHQVSANTTTAAVDHFKTEKEPAGEKLQDEKSHEEHEEEKTDKEKDDQEGLKEHQKSDTGSEGPVMVDAGDADLYVAHKKSHHILSGVGSKMKHSIAKVKKAITGKSSHPKPPK